MNKMTECEFKNCTEIGTHTYSPVVCIDCDTIYKGLCFTCDDVPVKITNNTMFCFTHRQMDICMICERILNDFEFQKICEICMTMHILSG